MSQLTALKRHSIVVADTGEVEEIRRLQPQDATTNPSLIAKAIRGGDSQELVDDALRRVDDLPPSERVDGFIDELFVNFGTKILEIIPGRVSTEVAARLSFDTQSTLDKARRLIALYDERGIDRERVLIKIASTWEGVRAAEVLEGEGIHCNMTLLFSLVQAVACAEAKATLISPFVGRIYDWFKKDQGVDDIPLDDDPGVASVREIYDYLKKFDYGIEIMGASFRKARQITRLAGCDLLTISPDLLDELDASQDDAPRMLDIESAKASSHERIPVDENHFRWLLNEDAMGTEKLAEGIRRFHADALVLEELAQRQLV